MKNAATVYLDSSGIRVDGDECCCRRDELPTIEDFNKNLKTKAIVANKKHTSSGRLQTIGSGVEGAHETPSGGEGPLGVGQD